MAKTGKRREKRSAEEWAGLVREWRGSGKTGEAFARERDLSRSSLYWWASELKRRGSELCLDEPEQAFVAVRVVDERRGPVGDPGSSSFAASGSIELVASTGRVIRLYGSVDSESLATVLQVAERC